MAYHSAKISISKKKKKKKRKKHTPQLFLAVYQFHKHDPEESHFDITHAHFTSQKIIKNAPKPNNFNSAQETRIQVFKHNRWYRFHNTLHTLKCSEWQIHFFQSFFLRNSKWISVSVAIFGFRMKNELQWYNKQGHTQTFQYEGWCGSKLSWAAPHENVSLLGATQGGGLGFHGSSPLPLILSVNTNVLGVSPLVI